MEITRKFFCVSRPLTRRYATKLPGLLDDISVLDLTRVVAGPYCTMMLGDLGANVIKVESLDGDESRKWGPPFIPGSSDSFYFLAVNRNKKSICIDLKKDEGKKIIFDLSRKCDVMVENFLPGKLDKMDVGYERLRKVNPRLVYCAVTGFGPKGPYASKPGYDVIAAAMGGLMNITGEKDGNPVKVGVAITDITTGMHAFGAIMTALYYRQKTGKGQKIDCNLLSTQIASMEPAEPITVLTLRQTKPAERKKVVWTEDTVDNEDMNKKKSKCCCIYEKPHKFDESSSESDSDECEHCFGHVERKKQHRQHRQQASSSSGGGGNTEVQDVKPEPTAAVTLKKTEDPSPAPAPPDKKPPAP